MIIPPEKRAIKDATESLRRLLGFDQSRVALRYPAAGRGTQVRRLPDAIARIGGLTFLLEYKQSGKVSSIVEAIDRLADTRDQGHPGIWLLVVPYMYEHGRARCREAGISWIDLSGNADISGPGMRVSIQGQPDSFRTPGRPPSLFAPKSSRVARILLYKREQALRQRQLSVITHLEEGYVSRIVRRLEVEGLIERVEKGAVRARNPDVLLDAWLEAYDFSKHSITRGHIPARSGLSLLKSLSNGLTEAGIDHAATGLGAAWLYTRFASFRLVTVYVTEAADPETLSRLDFTETEVGANTWIVLPNDEAVFWERATVEGVSCVHPVQVFLDLKGHPERASEAAGEVRGVALRSKR